MFRFGEYLYWQDFWNLCRFCVSFTDRKQSESVRIGGVGLVLKEKGIGCLCTSSEIGRIKERIKAKELYRSWGTDVFWKAILIYQTSLPCIVCVFTGGCVKFHRGIANIDWNEVNNVNRQIQSVVSGFLWHKRKFQPLINADSEPCGTLWWCRCTCERRMVLREYLQSWMELFFL